MWLSRIEETRQRNNKKMRSCVAAQVCIHLHWYCCHSVEMCHFLLAALIEGACNRDMLQQTNNSKVSGQTDKNIYI